MNMVKDGVVYTNLSVPSVTVTFYGCGSSH